VDLSRLLLVQGVRTMNDLYKTLVDLPMGALAVIDSFDTLPIEGTRTLTAGYQGVGCASAQLASLSSFLITQGVSVLVLSQLRYNPKYNSLVASTKGMEEAIQTGLSIRTAHRETVYGEKSWSTYELISTRNLVLPPGRRCTLYSHPELGISPERELLEGAKNLHGATWRSSLKEALGVALPNGWLASATYLREHPSTFDALWRYLCQVKK
jgi:hypothetical protein